MPFDQKRCDDLAKPLNGAYVQTRRQGGQELSYIAGWHAISEANRIFGFDGWRRETVEMRVTNQAERTLKGGDKAWGVSYIAKCLVCVDGVIREGWGSGHGIDRDLGLAHESAVKEAETDAFKRAMMTFGNQFGLALYDKEQANVEYEAPGPSPAMQAALQAISKLETRTAVQNYVNAAKSSPLTDAEFEELRREAGIKYKSLPEESKEA